MENPLFTAIEPSIGLSANALEQQARKALLPFGNYLDNSIKALNEKQVKCSWKPVADYRYQLVPKQCVWSFIPRTELKIIDDLTDWYEICSEDDGTPIDHTFEPDIEDKLTTGKGRNLKSFSLNSNTYRVRNYRYEIQHPELQGVEQIQWSGYRLNIKPLSLPLDNLKFIEVDGKRLNVIKQSGKFLVVRGFIKASDKLTINNQQVNCEISQGFDEAKLGLFDQKREQNGWLLFTKERPEIDYPCDIEDVTGECLKRLSAEQIRLTVDLQHKKDQRGGHQANKSKGNKHDPEFRDYPEMEKGRLTYDDSRGHLMYETSGELPKSSRLSFTELPIDFSLQKQDVKEKWLQLEELDNGEENSASGQSELDYFFTENSQNLKLLDSQQHNNEPGYAILKSRADEKQILLTAKNNKGRSSIYPGDINGKRELHIKADVSQLRKQKNTLLRLQHLPNQLHWPLLQLLQNKDEISWQDEEPVAEDAINWQILKDKNFDGCDRQREFVTKALVSKDFTILDGPPGTGKTTTILELIYQLVIQGKRILLTASTHAAINNVLERVKQNPVLSEQIFPLRIGNEDTASGVTEYQYDNLLSALQSQVSPLISDGEVIEQLMVESSNLVCGTTIGILRLFNNKNVVLERGEPPFDVMIIDECSKTPFQEFLVPALFAKTWVLVGDVRQLSPFTDREQIVGNLENLLLKPEKGEFLPKPIQRACLLLEELRGDKNNPYQQPMLLPVSSQVMKALEQEVHARLRDSRISDGLENIRFIWPNLPRQRRKGELEETTFPNYFSVDQISNEPWQLFNGNLYFVEKTVLPKLYPLLPPDMVVVEDNWPSCAHAFRHNLKGYGANNFHVKTKSCTDSKMLHETLLERLKSTSWADELCWRLERQYWLRLSENVENKTQFIEQTLQRLLPKSCEADGRVYMLKNIAFPSVLEALSGDGLVKRKNQQPTTLNQGFKPENKSQRHSTLSHQHRMHPDISAFPRKQFYPKGVLLDGRNTEADRAWSYDRFNSRNIWLDVRGKTQQNGNQTEVKAILVELKKFCDWAQNDQAKQSSEDGFDVAVLTFYKKQEKLLRNALQALPGNNKKYSRFSYKGVAIKLATVDYFQGQEADLVFLSMVNTTRDGFMDSPNRLNVALTRARYQLVIAGHHDYFSNKSRTRELKSLAGSSKLLTS